MFEQFPSDLSVSDAIHARAKLLRSIRQFFFERDVLEIEVPTLGVTAVTDPHLDSLQLNIANKPYFLQTSPEFFLKRLLADQPQSIYSLAKVFRADESGSRHNPEFTMLEWYRLGFSDSELMDEISDLIAFLNPGVTVKSRSYADLFIQYVGLDPHLASAEDLAKIASKRLEISWSETDKNTWLDLLFSHLVETELTDFTLVYDYPASQSALARLGVDHKGRKVAKRFEAFWKGVELGNGYWELTDPGEQRERFLADNESRKCMGKPEIALDEKFLAALEKGLPDCAGIAIGIDRLLMCLTGADDIQQVLPFHFYNL